MSEENCNCTMSQSMVGDGCKVCQPRTYIAHLEDALKSAESEITQLETELADAKKDQARYWETVKLYISGDLPLQLDTAESKKEFDLTIDAAIKEQQ